MTYKAWSGTVKVFYYFRCHSSNDKVTQPKLSVHGLKLQIEFTDGYKMMHKAWGGIEEVSY